MADIPMTTRSISSEASHTSARPQDDKSVAMRIPSTSAEPGWRLARSMPSLPEVFASVRVPANAGFWRKLLAFAGPGLMVSVGYMDPGNWATDLAGGAQFGYLLLSVIMISNFMAILLQHLALKLGIVTERDLAQACRDHFQPPVAFDLGA